MKKQGIIVSACIIMVFLINTINTTPVYAGWGSDTIGDADEAYFDITKLTISKTELTITLNENPYLNNTGHTWKFYNVWVDTSMEDIYPNTTHWPQDEYEYQAHFDCRWNGSSWLNNSYIQAFRYYLTADGSAKVEGHFFWDGNSWEGSDPDLDMAVVSGNNITFEVEGAIFREQPLGTGYVVQGVANAGPLSPVADIAPNSGWVDEFDNMCEYPDSSNTTDLPMSTAGLLAGIGVLGVFIFNLKLKRRK